MNKKELLVQCILEGLSNRIGLLIPTIELEKLTKGALTKEDLGKNLAKLQKKGALTMPMKDHVLLKGT